MKEKSGAQAAEEDVKCKPSADFVNLSSYIISTEQKTHCQKFLDLPPHTILPT